MQDRNLWDVSIAPTIVMTQQGVRSDMQVSSNHPFFHVLLLPSTVTAAFLYLYLPHCAPRALIPFTHTLALYLMPAKVAL
jgi:hypothetical protein